MNYEHATGRMDFSPFSTGSVFRSRPGMVGFPLRLAHEFFERCIAILKASGTPPPYTIYDPCCGTAVHLFYMYMLRPDLIANVIASDISPDAVEISTANLSLAEHDAMSSRAAELTSLGLEHNKPSYHIASNTAKAFTQRLETMKPMNFACFQRDALCSDSIPDILRRCPPHITFADTPYGRASTWQGAADGDAFEIFLRVAAQFIAPSGVLCVATAKGQKLSPNTLLRINRVSVGKRLVTLYKSETVVDYPDLQ